MSQEIPGVGSEVGVLDEPNHKTNEAKQLEGELVRGTQDIIELTGALERQTAEVTRLEEELAGQVGDVGKCRRDLAKKQAEVEELRRTVRTGTGTVREAIVSLLREVEPLEPEDDGKNQGDPPWLRARRKVIRQLRRGVACDDNDLVVVARLELQQSKAERDTEWELAVGNSDARTIAIAFRTIAAAIGRDWSPEEACKELCNDTEQVGVSGDKLRSALQSEHSLSDDALTHLVESANRYLRDVKSFAGAVRGLRRKRDVTKLPEALLEAAEAKEEGLRRRLQTAKECAETLRKNLEKKRQRLLGLDQRGKKDADNQHGAPQPRDPSQNLEPTENVREPPEAPAAPQPDTQASTCLVVSGNCAGTGGLTGMAAAAERPEDGTLRRETAEGSGDQLVRASAPCTTREPEPSLVGEPSGLPVRSDVPLAVSVRASKQDDSSLTGATGSGPQPKRGPIAAIVRSPGAMVVLAIASVLATVLGLYAWWRGHAGQPSGSASEARLADTGPSAIGADRKSARGQGSAVQPLPLPCGQCTESESCPSGKKPASAKGCVVRFVSFDPFDTKAYDDVACEFSRSNQTIHVKRISCPEFREGCLQDYRGGVFTWQPGHPSDAAHGKLAELKSSPEGLWGPLKALRTHTTASGSVSIPFKFYPWAFYYHKETIKRLHLTHLKPKSEGTPRSKKDSDAWVVPETWQELKTTADEMKAAGVKSPIAFSFAVEDSWTAIGTFDILHIRLRGYGEHEDLMRTDTDWNAKRDGVEDVFRHWVELAKYYPDNWKERTIKESTKDLLTGQVGMYFIGSFFLKYAENHKNEFGLFNFPPIDTAHSRKLGDTNNAIYAPIDSFVISANPDDAELGCAHQLIAFLGSESAFEFYNRKVDFYLSVKDKWTRDPESTKVGTPQDQARSLMIALRRKWWWRMPQGSRDNGASALTHRRRRSAVALSVCSHSVERHGNPRDEGREA